MVSHRTDLDKAAGVGVDHNALYPCRIHPLDTAVDVACNHSSCFSSNLGRFTLGSAALAGYVPGNLISFMDIAVPSLTVSSAVE